MCFPYYINAQYILVWLIDSFQYSLSSRTKWDGLSISIIIHEICVHSDVSVGNNYIFLYFTDFHIYLDSGTKVRCQKVTCSKFLISTNTYFISSSLIHISLLCAFPLIILLNLFSLRVARRKIFIFLIHFLHLSDVNLVKRIEFCKVSFLIINICQIWK